MSEDGRERIGRRKIRFTEALIKSLNESPWLGWMVALEITVGLLALVVIMAWLRRMSGRHP